MWSTFTTRLVDAAPRIIRAPSYGSRPNVIPTPTGRPNGSWLPTGNNGARIAVEHTIGMIKRHRITTRPFWGTPEELNDKFNIVSGLVNLNLYWDRIKKENDPLVRELPKKRASR